MADYEKVKKEVKRLLEARDGPTSMSAWVLSRQVSLFCEANDVMLIGDVLKVLRDGEIVAEEPSTRDGYPKYEIVGESPNSGGRKLRVRFTLHDYPSRDENEGLKLHHIEWCTD